MATEIGRGVIPIGFDPQQAAQAAKAQLGPAFTGIAQDLAGALGGAFATIKIKDFIGGGLDELKASIGVSAQAEQQLKNLGGAAGITLDQIDALSHAMLDQSGVDDELAKSAAVTALRLGVQGDAVRRVVQDANDLSQSYGDITSDSELLAKALAKPEQAARLLKPAIGALTDAQVASIQAFTTQGKIAEAGGVILDAVEAKVHGAAVAFGETLPGELKKADEEFKNAQASIVQGFAPALELGAHVAVDFSRGLQELPDPIRETVGAVVLLGGGAASLAATVSNVVNILNRYKPVQDALTASAGASTLATEAQALAQTELSVATVGSTAHLAALDAAFAGEAVAAGAAGAATTVALGPIGLLGIAAGGLVATLGLVSLGEHNAAVDTADFTQALRTQSGELDQNIAQVAAHALAQDKGAQAALSAGVNVKTLTDAIQGGTDNFGAYSRALDKSGSIAVDVGKQLRDAGAGSTEYGKTLLALHDSGALTDSQLADLTNTVEGLHNKFVDQKAATDAETAAQHELGGSIDSTTTSIGGQTNAQQLLNEALQKAEQTRTSEVDLVRGAFDAEQRYESATRSVQDALHGREQATQRVTDAQKALNKALEPASEESLGKANLDIESAHLRVGDAAKAVRDAEAEVNKERKDGKHTADDVADAQRKVEEANIAYQQAVYGVTDAETRLQDLQKKGTDQDPAVITARQNLATAQDGLKSSTDRVTQALKDQADADVAVQDANYKLLNGGVLPANVALEHELNILSALEGQLDPSNPLHQNLDIITGQFGALAALFASEPGPGGVIGPGRDYTPPGYIPKYSDRAIGGPLEPLQMFQGAEEGPELLWKRGIYQAPARGGYVSTAAETDGWLKDMWGSKPGGRGVDARHIGDINVFYPAPEPASTTVGHELQIREDRARLVG